jgi:hypothetical protein
MMIRPSLIVCLVVLGGAACLAVWLGELRPPTAWAAQKTDAPASDPEHDLAHLEARLAMVMADYHASNLWFAGSSANWPLAEFYWKEVQAHIEMSPKSDLSGKNEAELKQIAAAIAKSPTMQVAAAIEKQDLRTFASAYRGLLVGCYDCHKAAGKPYLRPRLPVRPSRSIINVDPKATWPQ